MLSVLYLKNLTCLISAPFFLKRCFFVLERYLTIVGLDGQWKSNSLLENEQSRLLIYVIYYSTSFYNYFLTVGCKQRIPVFPGCLNTALSLYKQQIKIFSSIYRNESLMPE